MIKACGRLPTYFLTAPFSLPPLGKGNRVAVDEVTLSTTTSSVSLRLPPSPKGKALFSPIMRYLFLANLVADRAGSLACGLAGSLALAAAARLERSLQLRLVDRLDVFHH